jgi:hypothetical protein
VREAEVRIEEEGRLHCEAEARWTEDRRVLADAEAALKAEVALLRASSERADLAVQQVNSVPEVLYRV